jgi:hypothetical protein
MEPKLITQPFGSALKFTPIELFPERRRVRLAEAMTRARTLLADAFKGITADGRVVPDLFPLVKTGVSLRPVIDAANAFAASLNAEQRAAATFAVAADTWRTWHNMHPFLFRHGIALDALDPAQRSAALALVRVTLSAAGFTLARNVMKLNEHVAELTGRTEEYGEWYYFMSLFGEPSETEPWGWQIDGHHLIINCFVLGDQLVLTPDFSGSEPVAAASGAFAGTRVFEAEESLGLRLMESLSATQRAQATIGATLPRDVLTTAQVDNLELPYAGIRYDALTEPQRELLLELIGVYTGRIRPGHAEIRMAEVRAHLADTYFGWIGACDAVGPFYYRVHNPAILIEFDHLPGLVYDNTVPTRNHIHTIVRTPNGNDYGRDLLRRHYEEHDHSHPQTAHRRGRP